MELKSCAVVLFTPFCNTKRLCKCRLWGRKILSKTEGHRFCEMKGIGVIFAFNHSLKLVFGIFLPTVNEIQLLFVGKIFNDFSSNLTQSVSVSCFRKVFYRNL